jgi:serine/threonine protein kinase
MSTFEKMCETLIYRNFPHVVTVKNSKGDTEELIENDSVGGDGDVICGMRELHSAGITVCDIRVGRGPEGQVKITDIKCFGYQDEPPLNTRYNLPESSYVKFKSDIWCLGCFLIGKNIPKRFTKSQELLDGFLKDAPDYIKVMLKVDPSQRELPFKKSDDGQGCAIF